MACNGISEHTCVNCTKKERSLLMGLTERELELLDRERYVINYKKGEIIYKEGMKPSGLLCLNSGKVKITRTAGNGTEQIVALKKPVDFIDVRCILGNSLYQNTAIALEDSSVCIIEGKDFTSVVKNNPDLSLKIIRMFAKELDASDSRFVNMTQKHLRARLSETLLHLYDFYGSKEDGQTINCILKRSDLAGLSNMTTANVIRTISAFKKEGILESEKKNLRIKNVDKLRAII